MPTSSLAADEIDLSDKAFWALPERDRERAFEVLRKHQPVSFHVEAALPGVPHGPGYWAVTRHEDVWEVSRKPGVFRSGSGVNIPDLPEAIGELFGSMIAMDDPRHARLRGLVNRGFTPRTIERLRALVEERARRIIDDVAPRGECDAVHDIAARLPLLIIGEMLGIPESDQAGMLAMTNNILGVGDPDFVDTLEDFMGTMLSLHTYAVELGNKRLADPRDDITSLLMHAEVDGDRLSSYDFASFFILLVLAGNETTRTAISHGMKALCENPAQREAWLADFDRVTPTAVEEILRWSTPVIHFRRTTAGDTAIGGQPIGAGEKVVLWYNSANRDDAKFKRPYDFDVRRSPNDHVAFGAGGPHFCLGAHLARLEMTVLFDEVLHRLPDMELTAEPEPLQSNFVHGMKRMPCRYTPTRA